MHGTHSEQHNLLGIDKHSPEYLFSVDEQELRSLCLELTKEERITAIRFLRDSLTPGAKSRTIWTEEAVVRVYLICAKELTGDEIFLKMKKVQKQKCLACGHESTTTLSELFQGIGCRRCYAINHPTKEKAHKEEDVFAHMRSQGMHPLPGQKYQGVRVPIYYWCEKGNHVHKIYYPKVQAGTGCGKCNQRIHAHKQEEVFAHMRSEGMHPLPGEEYVDNNTPIRYWCEKGNHVHQIRYNHFLRGVGCRLCQTNRFYWDEDYAREKMLERGMVPLSSLVGLGQKSRLYYHCLKCGNDYEMSVAAFLVDRECGMCRSKQNFIRRIWYSDLQMKADIASRLQALDRRPTGGMIIKDYGHYLDLVEKAFSDEYLRELTQWRNELREQGLELDHVIPCFFWDLTTPENVAKCWSRENLRPLFDRANHSRQHCLTISELVECFDSEIRREMFNECCLSDRKLQMRLPEFLEIDQHRHKVWCDIVEIPEADRIRYQQWRSLEDYNPLFDSSEDSE